MNVSWEHSNLCDRLFSETLPTELKFPYHKPLLENMQTTATHKYLTLYQRSDQNTGNENMLFTLCSVMLELHLVLLFDIRCEMVQGEIIYLG